MRYVFGFLCVCALGAMPLVGCSETTGDGGSGGAGGSAGAGGAGGAPTLCKTNVGGSGGTLDAGGSGGADESCVDDVCPCSEAGMRAAVRAGGGPYTFDCDGPTTIAVDPLDGEFLIDRDVSLNGEGKLTVLFGFFSVDDQIAAELRGLTVGCGGVSVSFASLTVADSNVIESPGRGITSIGGLLEVINTTVSRSGGDGIGNGGTMTMTNTTVSQNGGWGISTVVNRIGCNETVITNSVVSGNELGAIANCGEVTMTNTVIEGQCAWDGAFQSEGGNIESPGDTCGFDQTGDQPGVTAEQLNLGPLADNGGPTETHALLPGSVAIDQIPVVDCVDADGEPLTTDQRGLPRPGGTMCDVGAFEVQP